ncbi:MAG TPA: hypothetical protein VG014_13875, partial [Acidimicrobiales bacterium]|nr:hypothetical protein [Acidimicrobiales bacterium]
MDASLPTVRRSVSSDTSRRPDVSQISKLPANDYLFHCGAHVTLVGDPDPVVSGHRSRLETGGASRTTSTHAARGAIEQIELVLPSEPEPQLVNLPQRCERQWLLE